MGRHRGYPKEMAHCCFGGCDTTTCRRCGTTICRAASLHDCQPVPYVGRHRGQLAEEVVS